MAVVVVVRGEVAIEFRIELLLLLDGLMIPVASTAGDPVGGMVVVVVMVVVMVVVVVVATGGDGGGIASVGVGDTEYSVSDGDDDNTVEGRGGSAAALLPPPLFFSWILIGFNTGEGLGFGR